jgi:hypothetical protein
MDSKGRLERVGQLVRYKAGDHHGGKMKPDHRPRFSASAGHPAGLSLVQVNGFCKGPECRPAAFQRLRGRLRVFAWKEIAGPNFPPTKQRASPGGP